VIKTGRNDPCPCGSGKKYKHCCLKKEAEGKSEAIGRDRSWDTMMDKLLDFSREARFQQELQSAFDLFWNRTYTIEEINSLDPMQAMNFLDWYAHDYRTAVDGRRIVEIFLDEGGSALSGQERELLEAQARAAMSAFEVRTVEEGHTVDLVDVFQETGVQVRHTPSLRGIRAGQLLLARLATIGDLHRFSWISAIVPPEADEDFKDYLREMFSGYQEEHFHASWGEFLRDRSYLFNHFLLKLRGQLPAPTVLLPFQQTEEGKPRPVVLTPGNVDPEERPSVLVPGQKSRRPPSKVLVPGRDV
jgi:hypothetical protein